MLNTENEKEYLKKKLSQLRVADHKQMQFSLTTVNYQETKL